MRHFRLRGKIGIVIGVLVLTALIIAGVGIGQLRSADNQMHRLVDKTAHKVYLCANMRIAEWRAVRHVKNAIISIEDEDSRQQVEKAHQIFGEAAQFRQELVQAIDGGGDRDEKRMMDEVQKAWEAFEKINREAETLSILNTNPKATVLSHTKIREQVNQMREALDLLLKHSDREADAKDSAAARAAYKQARLAAKILVLTFDAHHLLDRHVQTPKDEEKNTIEDQYKTQMKEIATSLDTLTNLVSDKERGACDRAAAAFSQFKQLASEVLRLSRLNSIFKLSEITSGSYRVALNGLNKTESNLAEHLRSQFITQKERSQEEYGFARWLIVAVAVIGIVLSLGLSLMVTRSITEPIARSLAVSESIAHGDLTQRFDLQQRDEIGQLATALNRVSSTLSRIVGEIRGVSGGLGGSARELHTVSHEMLAQSEEMATQAGNVASATEQMSTNISTMAAGAEQMSMNVASISSASEEISVNVGTISAAATTTAKNVTTVSKALNDITRSFQDIAREARESSQIAAQAMDQAAGATATMNALDRAAGEISKVTEVIKMIALQTNLLALNATIEATSAGEAGKGFAVVAHEIKELANQSARAAEDIAQKIEGVQSSTRKAVEVIEGVSQIIHTINTSAVRASEAVQKQTQAADKIAVNVGEASQGVENIANSISEVAKGTTDMSKNASEAAKGANDMSRNASEAAKGARDSAANIHGVSQATRDNTESAQKVNQAAEQLTRIADELHKLVGKFKIEASHE
jgi:methyl-accepting chemotaxis protein